MIIAPRGRLPPVDRKGHRDALGFQGPSERGPTGDRWLRSAAALRHGGPAPFAVRVDHAGGDLIRRETTVTTTSVSARRGAGFAHRAHHYSAERDVQRRENLGLGSPRFVVPAGDVPDPLQPRLAGPSSASDCRHLESTHLLHRVPYVVDRPPSIDHEVCTRIAGTYRHRDCAHSAGSLNILMSVGWRYELGSWSPARIPGFGVPPILNPAPCHDLPSSLQHDSDVVQLHEDVKSTI